MAWAVRASYAALGLLLAGRLPLVPRPAAAPRVLALWDVDHTLIETRGVGRAIFERAFESVTGRGMIHVADVSGRTEPEIMRETLKLHGIESTDELTERFVAALIAGYESAKEELTQQGRALPGASQTLARLAGESVIHQSVLSGNLRAVARIKLEVFGLLPYLDLHSGAYGDDSSHRPTLVGIAQARASQRLVHPFTPNNTILIGDTPKDIAAGLDGGAKTLAIASGKSSAKELREAGADVVLPDLEDAERVRGLVLGLVE